MNEPPADPAVADYLRRLDQALGDLPADRRREIVEDIGEHIDAVRRDRPGDIDALLLRLGTPEQIAAAALEDAALPQRGRPGPLELVAVALLTVGMVVTAGLGWPVGIVLLWVAPGWARSRKLWATLLSGLPILFIVLTNALDAAGVTGIMCPNGGADLDCPGGVLIRPGLDATVGLLMWGSFLLAPVAVAVCLGRPLWPGGWADVRATLRSLRPKPAPPVAVAEPHVAAAIEAGGAVGWFAGRPLASWGRRAAAFGIDALIFTLAMVAVTLVPWSANQIGTGTLPVQLVVAISVALLCAPVLVLVWNQGIEQGRTGQSWGKRLLGLRVVRDTTLRPLGPAAGFARFVLHQVVDAGLWYVGFLWPLWDERRQTLADKLVGSVVLDERGDRPDRARSSAGAQVLILAAAVALTVAFVALFFSYASQGP